MFSLIKKIWVPANIMFSLGSISSHKLCFFCADTGAVVTFWVSLEYHTHITKNYADSRNTQDQLEWKKFCILPLGWVRYITSGYTQRLNVVEHNWLRRLNTHDLERLPTFECYPMLRNLKNSNTIIFLNNFLVVRLIEVIVKSILI